MLSNGYTVDAMTRELCSGTISYVKMLHGDELIGFASYGPTVSWDEMQLFKLYIHPRFQRMGYGSALLQYIEQEAIRKGYKYLMLAVNKNNEKAVSAYTKNAYLIKESRTIQIGEGFYMDDYVMKKSLIE